jgi:Protein of unknown function (DUF3176)
MAHAHTAIVIILKEFDGKAQPEFAFKITLNALVQFIATAGTAAISSFALSTLGQLAWLSFKDCALPLGYLDLHRKVVGIASLALLFRLRFSLHWFVFVIFLSHLTRIVPRLDKLTGATFETRPLQWLVAIPCSGLPRLTLTHQSG